MINMFICRLKNNITQINETILNDGQSKDDEIFWLFRISFMYYSFIGFIITIFVAQLVSLLTDGAAQNIDESLLTPLFQSQKYKDEQYRKKHETKYVTIDQMLIELKKTQMSNQLEIDGINQYEKST